MLTTLVNTIGSLDKLFGVFKSNEDNLKVSDMLDKDKRGVLQAHGNIVSLVSDLIVEPKILITDELKGNDKLPDVIAANLDMFVTIYSKAFMVLNGIHGLDGQTSLSLLSNKFTGSYGVETLKASLQDVGINKFSLEQAGTEARDNSGKKTGAEFDTKGRMFDDMVRKVKLTTNYNNNGKKLTLNIDIMIKPVISSIPVSDIHTLIKTNGDETSVGAAWHAWRSGDKSLADVIFATSLVDDYKRSRLKDNSGTLIDVETRKRQALTKLATDGAIGLGGLYQMIITSATNKADINVLLRGKLDKERYKEKFLKLTSSLALTTMDDNWEMVTMYINGLNGSFDTPYKKLSKDKTNGMKDLFDILTMQKGI